MPLQRCFVIIIIAIAAKPIAAAEDGTCPADSGKYFDRTQGECVDCPLPSTDEQAQLHYSMVCRAHHVCCVPNINSTQKPAMTLEVTTKSPTSLTSATGTSSSTSSSGSNQTTLTPLKEASAIKIALVALAVVVVVAGVAGVAALVLWILHRHQDRRIGHAEDGQTGGSTSSKLAARQDTVSCTDSSSTEEGEPLVPTTVSHGSSPGMRSSSNQSDHTERHWYGLPGEDYGNSEGGGEDRPLPSLPSNQGQDTVGGPHEPSTVFNELFNSGTVPRESTYADNTATMDSGTYEIAN